MTAKKRVMMAMSGGVDSSVGAFLLKSEGYDVVGVTMCLGVKEVGCDTSSCCGPQAIKDAGNVCSGIGISHYIFDFSHILEAKVINKFVYDYSNGITPNPCIECNRSLKFDVLLKRAIALGFDYLATGHYAAIKQSGNKYFLKKAADKTKDQTYFLYPINSENLKNILFPLWKYTKEDVRRIAKKNGIPVADKKESQDICFIPDGNLKKFFRKRLGDNKSGNIVDLQGNVLGRHTGIHNYTIGQRKGLGLSSAEPLYVVSLDSEKNEVVCGKKSDLEKRVLIVNRLNMFIDNITSVKCDAKIRYAHNPAKCSITAKDEALEVIFDEPQTAITPGQSIVFYKDDMVAGGGIIEKVLI